MRAKVSLALRFSSFLAHGGIARCDKGEKRSSSGLVDAPDWNVGKVLIVEDGEDSHCLKVLFRY